MEIVTNTFQIANGGETQVMFNAFETHLPGFSAQVSNNNFNAPKAYLNYMLFPEDYTGTPQFGYDAVGDDAWGQWTELDIEIDVPFDGYIYIYVINESTVTECYFDDVTVVHDRNNARLQVTSTSDYYPFGMEIASKKYVNEGLVPNHFKYQGLYSEYDEYTHWNAFAIRGNYDSRLGTWYSQDPYAQFANPYVGMGNNPINGVDPDGGFFGPTAQIIAGAVVGGAAAGYAARKNGADLEQTALAALGGAVAGAGMVYGLQHGVLSDVGRSIGDFSRMVGPTVNTLIHLFKIGQDIPKGQIIVGEMWLEETIYDPAFSDYYPSSFLTGNGIEPYNIDVDLLTLGSGSIVKGAAKKIFSTAVKKQARKKVTKTVAKKSTKTINGFKSVGAAGRNMNNIKLIKPNMLKKAGIDAHALKKEFLGSKGISKFDLYRHTETGEILILKKGGVGEAIFTGIFL
ncbi:hypothetical protein C900_02126 [Fulvivirga imtechensis AK7]|uniref:Bacterial toxin 33 domain-containing protein n=1 Tax=Fulvivirga imtechensis AK7 TaxID=1237149 RepID=L8JSJ1_9BACT|nr:RHS repeat-associated core domain-containing protein [Fulvivirga imtechensis]ELR71941.1 hypothetical protein C900_02126 [Fulvivirga imtechensis AK7]